MARPSEVIDDPTPLDGPEIGLGERIRWLLRVHRTAAGLTLDDVAASMRAHGRSGSPATLSAAERDGPRRGAVIGAYEVAVGLPPGHLRAPIDIVCRTFPYAPPDLDPGGPPTPRALDDVLDRAHDGGAVTGSEWFALGLVLGPRGEAWVPSSVARRLVQRLVSELVRSVGPGHLTRYEAVALLRWSRHGDLVEDAARDLVLEPGAFSVGASAMSAVTERPTERLLEWSAGLLADPDPWRLQAAALGLENMRSVGGLPETAWERLVAPLLAALADAEGDAERGEVLTRLFRNLPAPIRGAVEAGGARRLLRSAAGPTSWRRDDDNEHFARCREVAEQVSRDAGLPTQPMVARLLFEAVYDPRTNRAVTAGFLLMASPVVEPVVLALLRLTADGDPATRRGALRALQHTQVPAVDGAVRAWFAALGDAAPVETFGVAGNAGADVTRLVGLATDDSARSVRSLEALGLAGHAALPDLARRAPHPAVRDGARWWLQHGARVVA